MEELWLRYSGIYKDDSGDELLIISYDDHLRLLQPLTGHYRKLRQLGGSVFDCGIGFDTFEPVAAEFRFNSSTNEMTEIKAQDGHISRRWFRSRSNRIEAIRFMNGDVYLSGLLVKPSNSESYPAVVMLHGSGPAQWWWLLAFAEFFASFGVAALILDKRGIGDSTGHWKPVDLDLLAQDATSAFDYLQQRSDIVSDKIGFWGISQGSWTALRCAGHLKNCAFVIAVSSPAVTPIEQELYRVEHQLRAEAYSENVIQIALDLYRAVYAVWKNHGVGFDRLEYDINRYRNERWLSFVLDLESFNQETLTDFKNYDYDPLPALRDLTCPVLAIFGGLDVYLPVETSRQLMHNELSAAHHHDYTLTVFPEGDHAIRLPSTALNVTSAGFVPDYLPFTRDWLRARTYID